MLTPERLEYMRGYREANRERLNGQSREHYQKHLDRHRREKAASAKTPKGRYATQKASAKARSIPWLFTFESWAAWWGEDFALRSQSADGLCMCRFGDAGPYSPENCYKATRSENSADQNRLRAL